MTEQRPRPPGQEIEPSDTKDVDDGYNPNHHGHSSKKLVDDPNRCMTSAKPKITIFTRSYPPAYLSGGPARSVYALVEALAAEFSFSVITSAFDGSSLQPMPSVESGQWGTFGHATIWYESTRRMSSRTVTKLLSETAPQVIYLNSFFSYRFTVLPMLVARMKSRGAAIILAPRGELSTGALTLKRSKKRIYIALFRLFKLHSAITWHASTSLEQADIESRFGPDVRIYIAIDLRTGIFSDKAEHHEGQHHSVIRTAITGFLLADNAEKKLDSRYTGYFVHQK